MTYFEIFGQYSQDRIKAYSNDLENQDTLIGGYCVVSDEYIKKYYNNMCNL